MYHFIEAGGTHPLWYSIVGSGSLLLLLPFILLPALLIDRLPRLSAVIVSVGAMLYFYPLLGYFLGFFTKKPKSFGYTALITSLLLLLLPGIAWASFGELFPALKEWYQGWRHALPDPNIQEWSLPHLLLQIELPKIAITLIIVQVLHFQLLPCIKALRHNDRARHRELFVATLLLLVAAHSALNTHSSLIILSLTGMLLWYHTSNTSAKLPLLALALITLTAGTFAYYTHHLTIAEYLSVLPTFVIWCVGVVELWRGLPRRKSKHKRRQK